MNIVRCIVAFALVLFVNDIFVESIPKKLYNDLLTEDNELILIQQHNSSPKKASIKKNNTKGVETISSTSKLSSQPNDVDIKKNSDHLASKLIVNIVYASKQEENTPKSNTVSKRLVYEASSYLNPCDKNVCKSNETCVVSSENEKTNKHKCLPKPAKDKNIQTTQKIKHEEALFTSSKKSQFSIGCTSSKLIELKLNIFAQFEALKSKNADLKQSEIAKINLAEYHCVESVGFVLNLIDTNNDEFVSLNEWTELSYVKNELCSRDLFDMCANTYDGDKKISFKEFCNCFQGIELKCKFMRNPLNFEVKYDYLEYLNERFQTFISKNATIPPRLTSTNYVPLCDIHGHFLPHQCDNKVNCWCVNESGEPAIHTMKNIHEDFDVIECEQS